MNWLRRLPAFFVRCAELVPSPCCGEHLSIIGSRPRTRRDETGEKSILIIRRMRCGGCRRIHHELPDCLVPYKRYASACIEQVVSESAPASVAADEATLYRWRIWIEAQVTYLLGCLASLEMQFQQDPVKPLSDPSRPAHQRFGHWVGNAAGWLARVVRPIANANLWVQTRSAFLSATR